MGAVLFTLLAGNTVSAQSAKLPPPPKINASCAILEDADTGQVLYSKNPDIPRPPASCTKIMTAILLLEHTDPDDIIVASKNAADTGGSSMYLQPGERITAHDLLYAILMLSANDGCVAAAEHIAGSTANFVKMMNKKASAIGCTHTHFSNCNGLSNVDHYTTAADLALMARYAFQIPEFDKVIQTKYYRIHRSINQQNVFLRNIDHFLWNYPGAIGVKTGFTDAAGWCFVGSATRKGWRLVSVLLNCPDIYHETAKLDNWAYNNYQRVLAAKAGTVLGSTIVIGGKQRMVSIRLAQPVYVEVPKNSIERITLRVEPDKLKAPVAIGEPAGRVIVQLNGKPVVNEPLTASASVAKRSSFVAASISPYALLALILFGFGILRYGNSITKIVDRRRNRLETRLREFNRFR